MNKTFKIILLIVAIIVLIFLMSMIAGRYILPNFLGENSANNPVFSSSTDFTLLNLRAQFFDLPDQSGNSVSLTKFLNTPTILVFWATWNQQSVDQIKILDDFISSGDKDASLVSFLAIDSQEDPSVAKSLIKRGGYDIPFAFDTYGDTTDRYHVKSLPTFYFIDRNGIVREIYAGILSQQGLVDKAEQIIKQ
jgi:peroxiredoxin